MYSTYPDKNGYTEKIVVYTVIFGGYDQFFEPKVCPDNCDFFLISDRVVPQKGSV